MSNEAASTESKIQDAIVQQTYDTYWKELVENSDGTLNRDQILSQLAEITFIQQKAEAFRTVQAQARRYLEARHGKDVWSKVPEIFGDVLDHWLWAVASNSPAIAEEDIKKIEHNFAKAFGQEV